MPTIHQTIIYNVTSRNTIWVQHHTIVVSAQREAPTTTVMAISEPRMAPMRKKVYEVKKKPLSDGARIMGMVIAMAMKRFAKCNANGRPFHDA